MLSFSVDNESPRRSTITQPALVLVSCLKQLETPTTFTLCLTTVAIRSLEEMVGTKHCIREMSMYLWNPSSAGSGDLSPSTLLQNTENRLSSLLYTLRFRPCPWLSCSNQLCSTILLYESPVVRKGLEDGNDPFSRRKKRCWGGRQVLSLGDGCIQKGIIVHEMMHTVGFFHEQSQFFWTLIIKLIEWLLKKCRHS